MGGGGDNEINGYLPRWMPRWLHKVESAVVVAVDVRCTGPTECRHPVHKGIDQKLAEPSITVDQGIPTVCFREAVECKPAYRDGRVKPWVQSPKRSTPASGETGVHVARQGLRLRRSRTTPACSSWRSLRRLPRRSPSPKRRSLRIRKRVHRLP
jgi:hypothetical protein